MWLKPMELFHVFENLHADITKVGVILGRKNAAIAFRDSFVNDNSQDNAHPSNELYIEKKIDMILKKMILNEMIEIHVFIELLAKRLLK